MNEPAEPIDDDEAPIADSDQPDADHDLNDICERWARWCDTRRFYVKPSLPVSVLGRLRTKGTGRSASGGPDAALSAELMAFHIAYTCASEPRDAIDLQVFDLYYRHRVSNVKAAAAALGISRQHFYRLLTAFRRRVYLSSREVLAANLAAAQQLPHYRPPPSVGDL